MEASKLVGLLLLLVGCLVVASPPSSHVEHESQDDTVTHTWVKRSRVPDHLLLPVRIGLTQSNLDHGHDLLMRLSDPTSKEYGRHYSVEEVFDLFAPSQQAVETVRTWIESAGIHSHRISLSNNKQWLQFDARTFELEALLHTKYHHYDLVDGGSQAIACERYHLPANVQPHVDFIKPGIVGTFISSGEHKSSHSARKVSSGDIDNSVLKKLVLRYLDEPKNVDRKHDSCAETVTPACIRKLYNITDAIKKMPGNNAAIFSTQRQYYNETDLDLFFKTYAKEIKQGTRPINKYVAGARKQEFSHDGGGSEDDLDLQMIYPFVYPDEVINIQVYDRYYQNYTQLPRGIGFNVFLDAIDGSYCNTTAFGVTGNTPKIDGEIPNPHKFGYKGPLQCGIFEAPKVVSFSYGSGEEALPVPYQRRLCQEFMKLGLQGTSFIFASGDSGVRAKDCKTSTKGVFQSDFPSPCPYVTSVGGTRVPQGAPIKPGIEHAAGIPKFNIGMLNFYSGGGFSNIYPRPAYQDKAVQHYFKISNPPYPYYETNYTRHPPPNTKGRYNRIGRGSPDVAAVAQHTANVFHSKPRHGYGTSASAPLFAGLIARINNHRLSAGKSTLGFLNPSMYHNPSMFNDVTKGRNPGCTKRQEGFNDGFLCAPGWDPVTGLGSPNYGKMLEYYMSLP